MKLPPIKRILGTDVLEVSNTINNFFQVVWQSLDRGLSFQDNIDCQVVDVTAVGGVPFQLSTTLRRPVQGILVLSAQGGALLGGVSPEWQQVENTIQIKQLTGLTAGAAYKVRLLLL